jgi:hypothetical protein
MMLVGHRYCIRSERRLCEDVHPNLTYRWFGGSASMARCQIIRPSQRTDTVAFAILAVVAYLKAKEPRQQS